MDLKKHCGKQQINLGVVWMLVSILGLIFLKYISDKFETKYNELVEEGEGFEEDRDEYTYENIFWVPKEARWDYIKDNAKDPKIG